MKTTRLLPGVCVLALWSQPALAQGTIETRTAFFAESYRFDAGLVFNKVRQYTVPVGVTVPFGEKGHVALSTGYTAVELYSTDQSRLSDQYLSGIMDTEDACISSISRRRIVSWTPSSRRNATLVAVSAASTPV